jgi:two-component system, OmpR family, alkaline phosphatase synthesis response regulator PhoP
MVRPVETPDSHVCLVFASAVNYSDGHEKTPAQPAGATPMAETTPRPDDDPGDTVDISGSRILVVDDNEQNLELLVEYLDSLDCTIETAIDGIDALEKVEQSPPDLILLDIMMPRMSGFEVCRKLKSDPETRDIPIIMVTALNELGDIERGVESGTDDFISKPVNRLEMLTRVKSLLRVRGLQSELDRTLAYLNEMDPQEETQQ